MTSFTWQLFKKGATNRESPNLMAFGKRYEIGDRIRCQVGVIKRYWSTALAALLLSNIQVDVSQRDYLVVFSDDPKETPHPIQAMTMCESCGCVLIQEFMV